MGQVCMTKLIFLYSSKLQWPRGVSGQCPKISKKIFDLFRPRNKVVKVSSVNSELLFQSDTLEQGDALVYEGFIEAELSFPMGTHVFMIEAF